MRDAVQRFIFVSVLNIAGLKNLCGPGFVSSAQSPYEGSGMFRYRAISLTPRHSFDRTPTFVGSFEIDSFVFIALRP